MTISMHLRVAAGVCALSTGLLIAGPAGAIATAETGSDGATPNGEGAGSVTRPAGPVRGPIGSIADSLRKTVEDTAQRAVQGVTGTLSSLPKSGPQQSSGAKPPKVVFGGTPTVHGSTGSSSSSSLEITSGEPDPASEPRVVTPPAVEVTSVPKPTIPAASMPSTIPAVPDVAVPVSNVIAAVADSVASAPALVASLPTSATPVSDVIASLQAILTSVADASTPLVQLSNDLSALFGIATTVPGATTGAGTDHRVGASVATDLQMPMPVPMPGPGPGPGPVTPLPALLGFEVGPAPDVLAGPATPMDITTFGTSTDVTSSDGALTATDDGSSVLSIVQRVIGAVVATVSLTALVAIALPGIMGLLGTCAAGIRIGYRQAKAGSELPATAIARFVASGPVGVVRSGSQISLRPRVVRPASRHARTPRPESPVRSSNLQLLDRAV